MKHVASLLLCFLIIVVSVQAQTSAFTFQGRLNDGGTPANGLYDFQFWLFDTLTDGTGTQIGTQLAPGIQVVNGAFSATIDFGPQAFSGADRFIQVVVRPAFADPSVIPTILSPRQRLTSTPYALRSLSAATADSAAAASSAADAAKLGGVTADQYVLTGDIRLTNARPPTPGSPDYIQNGTSTQPTSNFAISGTGKAVTFDAASQFNLNGNRILSNAGTNNFFAGQGAGSANSTGTNNAFFGANAGQTNDVGISNSFFGSAAGTLNASGNFNAFFGTSSGRSNVDGNNNAFFGFTSGRNNSSGFNNSFFGNAAGFNTTLGGNNTFTGYFAGSNNTTGQQNAFFGASTGTTNTTGGYNTLVGYGTDVGSASLTNATAVGAQATVSQSDSLVLGSINGVNNATADTKVGIGTTAPAARLHVVGDGLFTGNLTVSGALNANISLNTINAATQFNLGGARIIGGDDPAGNFFVGFRSGQSLTNGTFNSFFGIEAGKATDSGSRNSFFGYQAGMSNAGGTGGGFFGHDNSYFGYTAGLRCNGSGNSFFGQGAGLGSGSPPPNDCTGSNNSFFGQNAGGSLTNGQNNAAVGQGAGGSLNSGSFNSFLGAGAGASTIEGSTNTFIGQSSGGFNRSGTDNTALGSNAWVGSSPATNNLTNATAIGANSCVTASDSLVLGSITNNPNCFIPAGRDTKVGIGTSAPQSKLHVVGDGLFTGNLTVNGTITGNITSGSFIQNTATQQASSNFNISGNGTAAGTLSGNVVSTATQFNIGNSRVLSSDQNANVFLGFDAGGVDPIPNPGSQNILIGLQAGGFNQGNRNVFVGFQAGQVNTTGTSNIAIGRRADFGSGNLNFATAIGANAVVSQSNSVVLGSISGVGGCTAANNCTDTRVGIGTTAPSARLHVVGDGLFNGDLTVNGTISGNLAGGSTNYIQNSTTQQANSNFSVSGNGILGGSMGIGTVSPLARLHVISNASEFTPLRIETNNPNGLVAEFGGTGWFAINDSSSVGGRFLINGNGNVGIGNVNPQAKLDITDGSNAGLRVQTNSAGGTVASFGANGAFQIDRPGAAGGRLTVLENGNVGINTAAPTAKLEVNGTIKGDGSGLTNVSAATAIKAQTTANLSLVGMLRWDLLSVSSFNAYYHPSSMAFDGANIWAVNNGDTISKLRASDGTNLGLSFVDIGPQAIAFDGANIWVTSFSEGGTSIHSVTRLRASDGANLGSIDLGPLTSPRGIAFDGANMWIVLAGVSAIRKIRASDLSGQGDFLLGTFPSGVAFDGSNMWVTNSGSHNVTKLRASDGATLGTFGVGNGPLGIAFDGANIWVANSADNNVTKLRASDGSNLGTFTVGTGPNSVAFDGENMWVTNGGDNSVTKLRANDGANLGTFLFGIVPGGVAFDGANVWISNSAGNNVIRVPSSFHQ